MATKSVSIRIPEEALAELEKIAMLKKQKVSDVVREIVIDRLTKGAAGDNRIVLEYLEGFGSVLAGMHNEAARSRFYAELMTSYAMDIQGLMVDGKVLDNNAKAALLNKFGKASQEVAQDSWLAALNYRKEEEPGSGQ